MIFVTGPFKEWSASQQMQLLQGMVGLAGFGVGGVALFFAGQQISRAFADPFLVLHLSARDPIGNFFLETEPGDRRVFRTNAHELLLLFEVTNESVTICREWHVELNHVRTFDEGSAELVSALLAIEESPWGDLPGKQQLDTRRLARLLRPYGSGARPLRPRNVRYDGTQGKGDEHADFLDAFGR